MCSTQSCPQKGRPSRPTDSVKIGNESHCLVRTDAVDGVHTLQVNRSGLERGSDRAPCVSAKPAHTLSQERTSPMQISGGFQLRKAGCGMVASRNLGD